MIFCFKSLILGKKNCMLFSIVSFFLLYSQNMRSSYLVCISWTAVFHLVNYVLNWVTWFKLMGINFSGLWTSMAALAAHQNLDLLQFVHIFLALGNPKLSMMLQMLSRSQLQCHTCQTEGSNPFHQPAEHTLTNTAHNVIGIPCCESPCLVYALLLLLWHPWVLSCKAAFWPLGHRLYCWHEVTSPQMQDFVFVDLKGSHHPLHPLPRKHPPWLCGFSFFQVTVLSFP